MSETEKSFIDKSPEALAKLYVEKMNDFLVSTGEEGATLRLNPDMVGPNFVTALQRVKRGDLSSHFQPIFLNTVLQLSDRAKVAREKGQYDTDTMASAMNLNDIAEYIRSHLEVKEQWSRLDLVDFLPQETG